MAKYLSSSSESLIITTSSSSSPTWLNTQILSGPALLTKKHFGSKLSWPWSGFYLQDVKNRSNQFRNFNICWDQLLRKWKFYNLSTFFQEKHISVIFSALLQIRNTFVYSNATFCFDVFPWSLTYILAYYVFALKKKSVKVNMHEKFGQNTWKIRPSPIWHWPQVLCQPPGKSHQPWLFKYYVELKKTMYCTMHIRQISLCQPLGWKIITRHDMWIAISIYIFIYGSYILKQARQIFCIL